ncbi:Retrovirus-related Pol polyprotein from type-2 retrotransposable element R2DM-like Protein [Tribolium castaneum]|uniref:Retrovirus-related Pol polyprotein from type-2 retrotransposable element R2DM-like Protein n=1 Tax=Tribolium castaneum TaxID=7070 RepID=A0A139W9T2_TRICA|nr:Retrovirus-related Pol polyprotein from type-2 retrotransposable element R2DM-like Protein [Tribolium castaneum]
MSNPSSVPCLLASRGTVLLRGSGCARQGVRKSSSAAIQRALNVNVKKFKQARVNGGSNYDSLILLCYDFAAGRNADGEPAQNPCPYCARSFTTANGRGLHIRRAHPDEANNAIDIERIHARWSDEETAMMARLEAGAIQQGGVRFMNQFLVPRMPGRTLEAVKGKRRDATYKALVQRFLQAPQINLPELRDGDAPRQPDPQRENPPEPPAFDGAIRGAVADLVGGVDWQRLGFQGDRLCDIARRACDGEDVSGQLLGWLRDVFPVKRVSTRGDQSDLDVDGASVSRRTARRREYARVQELYRKDPKACLARILGDRREGANRAPNRDPAFIDFWRGVFSEASAEVEGWAEEVSDHGELARRVWDPISVEEVGRSRVRNGAAPGPDGIAVSVWNKLPPEAAALLFNVLLLGRCLPAELTRTRTVFIPKTDAPRTPADYRPISIASVVARHFHRVLSARVQRIPDLFTKYQRGFLSGVDGIADNLSVLDTMLTMSRRCCKHLHLAALDVSKAFDTVSHFAIVRACEQAGLPQPFVEYVRSIYGSAETVLEEGGRRHFVQVRRGVRQGDPLSPLLFNLVLDRALKRLSTDVGFRLTDATKVTALAFADDVVLCATTAKGLQTNLDVLEAELRLAGLLLNPNKCQALSLVASGRDHKVKLVTKPTFRVGQNTIHQVDASSIWKYLGIQFRGSGMCGCGSEGVAAGLKRITCAPLKPQQRMHLLRVFFLPKFYHAWTFGRLNAGVLRRLDVVVRTYVRTWLRFPHDIPVGYFHAPTKSGGLGIPQLSRFIPFLRLKRFDRLGRSAVDYVRECAFTDIADRKIRWCRERLSGIVDQVAGGRDALDAYWTAQLHQSVDGRALRESASVASSTQWLRCSTRAIPASDWLHYTAVHIGALPSRVRTSRGRRGGQDVSCRGGCLLDETPAHCIQVCHRTHGGRVLRHDAIAKRISVDLMELGWIVTREVSFRTTAGVFRPDMVAVKEGVTVILDVQIVSPAPTLDEAHRRKVAKYRDRADLARYLVEAAVARGRAPPANIRFASATISWRGVWSAESVGSLRELGLSARHFNRYTTMALCGSWRNWVRFNASTASRMGRGRGDASPRRHENQHDNDSLADLVRVALTKSDRGVLNDAVNRNLAQRAESLRIRKRGSKGKRKSKTGRHYGQTTSGSGQRAALFKKHQDLFLKNRRGLAETILSGKEDFGPRPEPPVTSVEEFYGGIFESPSSPDNKPFERQIPVAAVKTMSELELAILFNIILFRNVQPSAWGVLRTTLVPITISSALQRLLHRVLAARLSKLISLSSSQRGFTEIDGTLANALILHEYLQYRRQTGRTYHVVSLDVRKAFDTVSHCSVSRALGCFGIPSVIREYILATFGAQTTIKCGSVTTRPIRMLRGVRQGDPLSLVLFNFVMDELLEKVNEKYEGGSLQSGERCAIMAFADDLILIADRDQDVPAMFDDVSTFLERRGMSVNPAKCRALIAGAMHLSIWG